MKRTDEELDFVLGNLTGFLADHSSKLLSTFTQLMYFALGASFLAFSTQEVGEMTIPFLEVSLNIDTAIAFLTLIACYRLIVVLTIAEEGYFLKSNYARVYRERFGNDPSINEKPLIAPALYLDKYRIGPTKLGEGISIGLLLTVAFSLIGLLFRFISGYASTYKSIDFVLYGIALLLFLLAILIMSISNPDQSETNLDDPTSPEKQEPGSSDSQESN